MSRALAIGSTAPLPDRCLRRCDDCGAPTWIPNEEGDAHWVVCEDCRRADASESAAVEAEIAYREGP